MTILEPQDNYHAWPRSKVNFIDERNSILIGYDLEQQCCEKASWYTIPKLTKTELESYNIDSIIPIEVPETFVENDYEYTHKVYFNLSKGETKAILVLENTHNGYYSHRYEVEQDDARIAEGEL